MLRRALSLAVLSCCALLAESAQARPPAQAVLVECERGLEERVGVFEGRMRAVPGAVRMQMRFTLQARTPERSRWVNVSAPGFGVWVASDEGTGRYVYTKRVENLPAPATYRAIVRFRWLDAAGEIVERSRAVSRTCRQPDPRPDLAMASILRLGDGAYGLLVRNGGRTPSEATMAVLSVDGAPQPAVPVPALEAGGEALLSVSGPACSPGGHLQAVVDPADAVDERSEEDNVLGRSC